MTYSQLDKYARDAQLWRALAEFNRAAARELFKASSLNPTLYFVAVTLSHNALELFLKTALICQGMTVFNPKKLRFLDASVGLKESDCVWGHSLVTLARELAERRPDFDLSAEIENRLVAVEGQLTVERAFAEIDPFFSELRYPQELKNVAGFGEDVFPVLDELVSRLEPFLS